ncbi:MAG: proton-conducting transporter membrane subunit [candidate division WOR-3 bacterium]
MHPFFVMLLVPAAFGLAGYLVGRLRNEFSFVGTMLNLYFALRLFLRSRHDTVIYQWFETALFPVSFRLDPLSGFILVFVAVFGVLIVLFSFRYMKTWHGTRGYYFYLLVALACSNGVLLAANLVTLLFFWGVLLVILYGLLLVGDAGAEKAARKALVVVGLSDFAMLLGIGILLAGSGWTDLAPRAPMGLTDPANIAAFVLIATGALAKAGSMPLHTWIPQASESSPATVMAFIPASLDKLLGIYLLTRISVYMFNISTNMVLRNVMMGIGALTVLAAVMMALVQKRVMRLLSFHAVSQVGYMVLGIGTGTPVGVAGGLFHMLNHATYKSGLFLAAGSVEYWTKNDEIEKLGGLTRQMPLTFFSFLVCALAIAGVPPLNGFVSKWMVYQGIIDLAREGSRLYPVFLVAAMLGSVLTLASFLKLLHAVFLGQRPQNLARVREGSFTMWLPTVILALLCIVFGIFAYQLPLRGLIYPALPFAVEPFGIWQPVLTTLLILVALGIGLVIYLLGTVRRPVEGATFVGGEKIADEEASRVPGTAFYSPVKQMPVLGDLLRFGETGAFDLYNWVVGLLQAVGVVFRRAIDAALELFYHYISSLLVRAGAGLGRLMLGELPIYLALVLLGAVLFYSIILIV